MLLQTFRRQINSFFLRKLVSYKFGESSHGLKPGDKAPTLNTATIPINVENFEGQIHRIYAQIGKTLFEELESNGIKTGGTCGGGQIEKMSRKAISLYSYGFQCGMCYCAVDEPWYTKMDIHPQETNKLVDIVEPHPSNTRFSCGIEVEGWMEEMTVRVLTKRSYAEQLRGPTHTGI